MGNSSDLNRAGGFSRRDLLATGLGLGGLALGNAFGGRALAANGVGSVIDKGILKTGHIPARAKRVVSIQMCGAVSQVDTFDYKPTLIERHGEEIPPSVKNAGGRISAMSTARLPIRWCSPSRNSASTASVANGSAT